MTRVSISIGVLALLAAAAAVRGGSSEPAHALCLGQSSYVSGMDVDDFVRMRKSRTGDFLWFRRGGTAYVVTDPGVLGAAREALQPARALEAEIGAVNARLKPYEAREEELDREDEAIDAAEEKLEDREDAAAEAERRRLEARDDELESRRRALEAEMRDVEAEEHRLEEREREVDRAVDAAIERIADEALQKGLASKAR